MVAHWSKLGDQIVISNTIFHKKEPAFLEEMAGFRAESGPVQDNYRISYDRPEGSTQKMTRTSQKNTEASLERLQLEIWNNLSIKINNK